MTDKQAEAAPPAGALTAEEAAESIIDKYRDLGNDDYWDDEAVRIAAIIARVQPVAVQVCDIHVEHATYNGCAACARIGARHLRPKPAEPSTDRIIRSEQPADTPSALSASGAETRREPQEDVARFRQLLVSGEPMDFELFDRVFAALSGERPAPGAEGPTNIMRVWAMTEGAAALRDKAGVDDRGDELLRAADVLEDIMLSGAQGSSLRKALQEIEALPRDYTSPEVFDQAARRIARDALSGAAPVQPKCYYPDCPRTATRNRRGYPICDEHRDVQVALEAYEGREPTPEERARADAAMAKARTAAPVQPEPQGLAGVAAALAAPERDGEPDAPPQEPEYTDEEMIAIAIHGAHKSRVAPSPVTQAAPLSVREVELRGILDDLCVTIQCGIKRETAIEGAMLRIARALAAETESLNELVRHYYTLYNEALIARAIPQAGEVERLRAVLTAIYSHPNARFNVASMKHGEPTIADTVRRVLAASELSTTLRCDRCGWECELGTSASKVGHGTYQQGSVHACQRPDLRGFGYMREVEASGTPERKEEGDGKD